MSQTKHNEIVSSLRQKIDEQNDELEKQRQLVGKMREQMGTLNDMIIKIKDQYKYMQEQQQQQQERIMTSSTGAELHALRAEKQKLLTVGLH